MLNLNIFLLLAEMFDLKEKAGKSCFPKMRPVDFKPTNQTRRLFIGQKLVNLV